MNRNLQCVEKQVTMVCLVSTEAVLSEEVTPSLFKSVVFHRFLLMNLLLLENDCHSENQTVVVVATYYSFSAGLPARSKLFLSGVEV